MRTPLLGLLLLAPALPGCVAAAAGATAFFVTTSTTLENQHFAIVEGRVPRVWAKVKTTLAGMTHLPIETLEDETRAQATIDNHTVIVTVKTYDLEKTQIYVEALQLGIPSRDMASEVLSRIVNEVSEGS